MFIMHLRRLHVFLLFLFGGARSSIHIVDSHSDAQQRNNTLSNAVEVSVEARETLNPADIGTGVFRHAGRKVRILRQRSKQNGRRAGHLEPPGAAPVFRSGPHRANVALQEDGGALAVLGGTLARVASERKQGAWVQMGDAWMLAPQSTPWAAVHFVGGAGFGSAPQLSYASLLSTVVERCGVVVIATPYDVAFDHWRLSESVLKAYDVARTSCQATLGLSADAPTFRLGHSLGAKLLVLGSLSQRVLPSAEASSSAAPAPPPSPPLGLIAFNNFALSDSIALASSFLAGVQGGERGAATASAVLSAFNIAQQFAKAAGTAIDVTPSPAELEEAVLLRYAGSQGPRVWVFDGDALDSSEALAEALPEGRPPMVTSLTGGHLAPVCFTLDPADLDPALAMLLSANGVDGGFTFGSEEAVASLADSVCEWLRPQSTAPPSAAEGDGADGEAAPTT